MRIGTWIYMQGTIDPEESHITVPHIISVGILLIQYSTYNCFPRGNNKQKTASNLYMKPFGVSEQAQCTWR